MSIAEYTIKYKGFINRFWQLYPENYGINRTVLFVWVERYSQHGEDSLKCHGYTKSNKQLRRQIVSEHLMESVSLTELELLQLRVKELQAENALLKK